MKRTLSYAAVLSLAAAACLSSAIPASGATHAQQASARYGANAVRFNMVRSTGAQKAACIPDARGLVTVVPNDLNDLMSVQVAGLPPNTDFDLFVTQLPDAPFGVSWYQSDLHTNSYGYGSVTVRGIFDVETFSLSLGGPAGGSDPTQGLTSPAVVDTNVVMRPTHQYHLGLWFNSPDDAARANCGATVTPFNGEQHAGIQALSTRNFPAAQGPLSQIHR